MPIAHVSNKIADRSLRTAHKSNKMADLFYALHINKTKWPTSLQISQQSNKMADRSLIVVVVHTSNNRIAKYFTECMIVRQQTTAVDVCSKSEGKEPTQKPHIGKSLSFNHVTGIYRGDVWDGGRRVVRSLYCDVTFCGMSSILRQALWTRPSLSPRRQSFQSVSRSCSTTNELPFSKLSCWLSAAM